LEIDTWRPRASISTEIHSFFLGGSVRVQNITEIVRTAYRSSDHRDEVVNRFGLETEDSGKIKINLNVCF